MFGFCESLKCFFIFLLLSYVTGCSNAPVASLVVSSGAVYINGRINTQDDLRREVDSMVISGEKILYAGGREGVDEFIRQGYPVIDLQGKMVLPGFHDNHVHTLGTVAIDVCDLQGQGVDLDRLAQVVRECRTRYPAAPGTWLIVDQWMPYAGNEPTSTFRTIRQALDAASADRPVMLFGSDGHASAYNSLGLAAARDEQGATAGFSRASLSKGGLFAELAAYVSLDTGVVRDRARDRIQAASYDFMTLPKGHRLGSQMYGDILPDISKLMAMNGITSIQDACATDFVRDQYVAMQKRNLLNMYVTTATCFASEDYAGAVDIPARLAKVRSVREEFADNPLIKADGVKIFLDGVLEGDPFATPPFLPTAGMLNNYQMPVLELKDSDPQSQVRVTVRDDSKETNFNGIVNIEPSLLTRYVSALDADGFATHIHSIGDRTARIAVDALQEARERNGDRAIPHTLANLQVIHPDDQKRMGALGLYLTYTYSWMNLDPEYDVTVVPFLQPSKKGQPLEDVLYDKGSYAWRAIYPVASSHQAGAILVAGSDAPVDTRDPNPFVNIASGITRSRADQKPYNSDQSATLEQMLEAYTINGARSVRQGHQYGSIEPGKLANFIVIDRNLFDLVAQGTPERIAQVKVERTVFRGRTIFTR